MIVLRALAVASAELILRGTYATARLLGPFRLGRLLQTVSLPRMREHRVRTTLTVLGIALGVAVVVSVLLVSRSIVSGVTDSIDDLAGKADLQISAGASGFEEHVFERVRAVKGVYKSTVALQQIVPMRTDAGRRERLLMVGVDLLGSEDTYFRDYESQELDTIRRDPLLFLNSTTNLILSEQVALRLGVGVHDHVSIATGNGWQRFEVWGLIRGGGVGSAFGGAVGLMYFPAMQVAFERGRNIDRIDVAVRPGRDPEEVAKSLEAALGESYTVERPASRGERVSKLLMALRTGLAIACVIAVIAGAFLVFNTISISIMQRKREFGTLRALGAKRSDLARLITLEGALLGVVGSALGIVLGLVISRAMLLQTSDVVDSVWMQQSIAEVRLDPLLVFAGFTLGLSAATLAALAATRRVMKMRPDDGLAAASALAAAKPSQGLWRSDLVGLVLLCVAVGLASLPPVGKLPIGAIVAAVLLPLIGRAFMSRIVLAVRSLVMLGQRVFGPTAMLASENLPRDLTRSASTASGLMASGALSVSLATFVVSFVTSLNAWTAQTVPGDLFVTSGATVASLSARNVPMADTLGPALLAIPGVERLNRMRQVTMEFQNARVSVLSAEVREFVKRSHLLPVEGTADELRDELLAGSVVVSENFATRFDVHRGDHIVLGTKDLPRSFRVAGVRIDYTSDQGTIFMDRDTYVANWSDARVDTYEVHLAPGVSAETVRTQINERLSGDHDLFVLTNREYRGHFTKQVDHIFGLLRVLELVTLLVATLGMLSAIWANVLDRVREVGVLRALGMLRKQVRRLIVLESAFVGIVGGIAGITVGAAIGYVMLRRIVTVQAGWYLPYQLPLSSMALFMLIALPISALAGFFPAREAARLSVRDALDYE